MNVNNNFDDIDFEKDLRSLERFEPPLNFRSQAKERIKRETKWFSVEKRLVWIPRVCIIGFAGIFIVLLIMSNQVVLPSYSFDKNGSLSIFLITLSGVAFIQLIFLFDLYLKKKLVLSE